MRNKTLQMKLLAVTMSSAVETANSAKSNALEGVSNTRRIKDTRDKGEGGGKFVSSIARSFKVSARHYDVLYVLAYVRCECARDGTRRDGRITYIYVDCVAMGATIIYNARHSVQRACLYGAGELDETAPIMNPRSDFVAQGDVLDSILAPFNIILECMKFKGRNINYILKLQITSVTIKLISTVRYC